MTWATFGSRRIVSVRPVTDTGAVMPVGDRRPEIPAWSDIRHDAAGARATPNFLEAAEARGWPFLSLSVSFVPASPSPSFAWESAYGVEIQSPADPANVYAASGRTLPLRPIWLGFIANTLIYAAALWTLGRVPTLMRRLVRAGRGLCPGCGYPPGDSDICTECGAKRRPAAKA
jgi:hypothetical protein